jgi:hypothetical protein
LVERLSAGDVRMAVARLDAQGRVQAIPDRTERLHALAADYATQPTGTLVVSPDNQPREALNAHIRGPFANSTVRSSTDDPGRPRSAACRQLRQILREPRD